MSGVLSGAGVVLATVSLTLGGWACGAEPRPTAVPAETRIEEALDAPAQVEFVETPLQDVVDFLRDSHKIEVVLDTAALNDVGIDAQTPITANFKGISLESALALLLRPLKLTWTVHNEALLITTPQEAAQLFTTRVFPLDDLVTTGKTDRARMDATALETLLRTTISPKSWDVNGGQGAIVPASLDQVQSLVIRQTYPVHRQVAKLLASLQETTGKKVAPVLPLPITDPPTAAEVDAANPLDVKPPPLPRELKPASQPKLKSPLAKPPKPAESPKAPDPPKPLDPTDSLKEPETRPR